MDSGTEVLRAVTAIAVAFETAADSLESIRDQKERKKRKREKDLEELFEIKILHKSLLHGANECRKHFENRRHQFGSAFEAGDAIALPALSDVIIVLQTEIHQALHRVRIVEAASLDLTALHETCITSRKDATRAMDQVCQRIMASIQFQSQQPDDKTMETWSPSESSMRSGSASVQPPSLNESCEIPPALPIQIDKRLPSLPAAIGHASRVIYQPIQRVFPQRAVSIRHGSDAVSQKKLRHFGPSPAASPALHVRESRTSLRPTTNTDTEPRNFGNGYSPSGSHTKETSGHSVRLSRTNSYDNSIISKRYDSKTKASDRVSTSSIQPSVFLVRDKDDTDMKASSATSITSLYAYQDVGMTFADGDVPRNDTLDEVRQSVDRPQQDRQFSIVSDQVLAVNEPQLEHEPESLPTVDDPTARGATPLASVRPVPQHTYTSNESLPQTAHGLGVSALREQIEPHSSTSLYFTINAGDYVHEHPDPGPRPSIMKSGPLNPSDQASTLAEEEADRANHNHSHPSAFTIDGGVDTSVVSAPVNPDTAQKDMRPGEVEHGGNARTDVEAGTQAVFRKEANPGDPEHGWLSPQDKEFEDTFHALRTPESIENLSETQFREKLRPIADLANEKFSASLTQADYQERLSSLPKGQNNVWLPLSRPALHNRYHGFCKGAWQIRKAAGEGLQVHLTPSLKEPVIHWQCAACNFNSKAPNADALPSHILFNQRYNVRYRWTFLAKSHRSASASFAAPDSYEYGCIFCIAQGHDTAGHEKLEHLFVHIMSKHKAAMLTPEIMIKTKAIVGSVIDKTQDWDIVLPDSGSKGVEMAADELRISVGKFWNRRKRRSDVWLSVHGLVRDTLFFVSLAVTGTSLTGGHDDEVSRSGSLQPGAFEKPLDRHEDTRQLPWDLLAA
ncbi:hypothetical protein Q7P37_008106 [Cladosporium fusiforme]